MPSSQNHHLRWWVAWVGSYPYKILNLTTWDPTPSRHERQQAPSAPLEMGAGPTSPVFVWDKIRYCIRARTHTHTHVDTPTYILSHTCTHKNSYMITHIYMYVCICLCLYICNYINTLLERHCRRYIDKGWLRIRAPKAAVGCGTQRAMKAT